MTDKERQFGENATLVSITDMDGVIQYCNRDFIEISGYSEQELINSNHNIVRHKDMPKAAFEDLWSTVKMDKPWKGIVKNRCKNGDFYWVDAYVTPVFENGKKVGYQSIRSCPSRKQIADAESLYKDLNNNQHKKIPKPSLYSKMTLAFQVNTIVALAFATYVLMQMYEGQLFTLEPLQVMTNLWIMLLFSVLLYLINFDVVKRINRLTRILKRISAGDLTEKIEIIKEDEIGETVMSAKMLQGRLKAIIGRFSESSHDLIIATGVLSETSHTTKSSMDTQHTETELVATAMNEMSATVSEIAQNTARTSELAAAADNAATTGKVMVSSTREAIFELSESLSAISESINLLANECHQIKDITESISGISEQTNLLALNAAIEAARAGEYGRGFAVVADEVRVLSSRTQQSTEEINTMIEKLQGGSVEAVKAVEKGLEKVHISVEKIESTENAFTEIATSVTDVNDMNMQIATAAEEQSSVAEEMNQNVTSISVHSYKTADSVVLLEDKVDELTKMSSSLAIQLEQYNLGETVLVKP
ncbi:methyl-accepting chemotaxis protein [Vibrio algarum]|uniref:PAS domain-containing methyl-accepting chemotaxis protein n=1 Tax=Vibrio algarum TaxID=3020714 RepID=A0ABT4YME1_9VIBR|nr:PAS domain-containing methyl-accepting chemotaxis protein [Vibrio sp. KJ40-1]MDB1122693.1 PAS domain-containing methyl-accepting chemotaxis protein [Vibrio sp. KJ40-1]